MPAVYPSTFARGTQTSGDKAPTTPVPEVNTGASPAQQKEASLYTSYIQAILRAVQLRAYNDATTQQKSTGDTSKDLKSYLIDFNGKHRDLVDSMFQFSYVKPLLASPSGPFAYGYGKTYMETEKSENGIPVNFAEILRAYVVFFRKENWGTENPNQLTSYPVYIPLSFFHLMLNAVGLLYQVGSDSTVVEEPIVYLDFNNKTTLCLANPQTFSIDPANFLVRYEVEDGCYQDIFLKTPLDTNSGGYFKKSEDIITTNFLPFRNSNQYQGLLLNTLVNIDYLLNKISGLGENNNANSAEFQTTLQSIYNDLSKAFGNINYFRIAYSDTGNVAYISDDQSIPAGGQVDQGSQNYILPNIGKTSVYHSLSMRTDTSTKIGNLVAISANSVPNRATGGADASPLSIGRAIGKDRYRKDLVAAGDNNKEAARKTPQAIIQATLFNSFVRNTYGKNRTLSDKDVYSCMQFYQNSMNELKATNPTTQATSLLPISLNFTMDGIAGFTKLMGFKIPDGIIPNEYEKCGFIVTGEEQTIESNRWITSIKGSMYFLRESGTAVTGCSSTSSPTTTAAIAPKLLGPTPGGNTAASPTIAPVQSGTQFVQGLPGMGSLGTNTPSAPSSTTSGFTNPLGSATNYNVSSDFGPRSAPTAGASTDHKGVDLAAPVGTNVYPTKPGTVTYAAWQNGLGNVVKIDHGNGLTTTYGHLSKINVTPGQQVGQGNVIGNVGSTGVSTGNHLHFGVSQNGVPVNPENYINFR